MERISSAAQIPLDYYVERAADTQLRNIITDMARPGYVLVARQMGKTNLLLHTKEICQSDKELYVYLDFSTMAEYTEEECLNAFIDTAIEVNWEIFEQAEVQIEELRSKSNYKASKMFSRELRILLKYVEKIVFILDEIDALTRRDYSDRIFSLIRAHYFASTNFPELKKATFILSGVIEPKDIIKDHNISPFNIGEKIYLLDFSYSEFKRLTQNFNCLKSLPETCIERLFYWTKGQPRISWDLCDAANRQSITSEEEIDELVNKLYLKSFDMAPIDSIRQMAANDSSLRDAIIQLAINKGGTLSPQIKSRLYLAGIINWEEGANSFKNPIMAKSLSYEWLMQLQSKEMNFLAEGEKSIELEKDYNKGISWLKKFIESSPDQKNKDKATYLIAQAYYRLEIYDDSIIWQGKIREESEYYNSGLLLKAYTLLAQGKIDVSNDVLRNLLKKEKSLDSLTYLRSAFAKIYNNLYRLNNCEKNKDESTYNELLDDTDQLLQSIIYNYTKDLIDNEMFAFSQYYHSLIYEFKGETNLCINKIDVALLGAKDIEKPWLYYKKLILIDDAKKAQVAKLLYESLEKLSSKKSNLDGDVNYENILILNTLYLSEMMATLMLDFPDFDVPKLLRAFWIESKEYSVIIIYNILEERNFERIKDFLNLLLSFTSNENWLFSADQLTHLYFKALQVLDDDSYVSKLLNDITESNTDASVINLLAQMTEIYIKQEKPIKVLELSKLYSPKAVKANSFINDLIIRYNECIALLKIEYKVDFLERSFQLINTIEERIRSNGESFMIGQIKDKINSIKNDLYYKRAIVHEEIQQAKILNKWLLKNIERNQRICVYSLKTGQKEIGKLKNLKNDLNNGVCKFINLVQKR